MAEKKQYTIALNFNPEQWVWFCEKMLGLAPGQEPPRGMASEYFRTGGSLLGMPEAKAVGAKAKDERTERRDYLREMKRKQRQRDSLNGKGKS